MTLGPQRLNEAMIEDLHLRTEALMKPSTQAEHEEEEEIRSKTRHAKTASLESNSSFRIAAQMSPAVPRASKVLSVSDLSNLLQTAPAAANSAGYEGNISSSSDENAAARRKAKKINGARVQISPDTLTSTGSSSRKNPLRSLITTGHRTIAKNNASESPEIHSLSILSQAQSIVQRRTSATGLSSMEDELIIEQPTADDNPTIPC
jgi:hypothetical protein